MGNTHIINFSQIDRIDLDLIGKKAYEISELKHLGVSIPDGFVILPFFYLSENLIKDINSSYRKLSGLFKELSLNIFSSSQGRSLTFLDIKGDANLIHTVKKIRTSQLGNPAAIIVQENIKTKTKEKIFTDDISIKNPDLNLIAKKIQKHFYFPQEIDYITEKGKIYVTSMKPRSDIHKSVKKAFQIIKRKQALIKGIPINHGIVTGPARVIRDKNFRLIKNNEIVVLSELDKSIYSKIKNAKAIIADKVIFGKFLQIPTIHDAKIATKIIHNGNIVTVNAMNGEIYSGGFI
ncbi:MAG: hypothetical protein Q7R51_01845 [bacterium]|nr:hypothetical protein [bacterium]